MGEELFQRGENPVPQVYYNPSLYSTEIDIESVAQNAVLREQVIIYTLLFHCITIIFLYDFWVCCR